MTVAGNVDVKKLVSEARRSCCGESYTILERNVAYRIGVGAIIDESDKSTVFIDITISLCPNNHVFNIGLLEKNLHLAKRLKDRDYNLTCVQGQITFEKSLEGEDIRQEYMEIKRIISEIEYT
jgi:hypothetical protein